MEEPTLAYDTNSPAGWFGPPGGHGPVDLERRRRAVSYHRFSKLGESPDSIDRQKERTRRHADRESILVVREYDEPRASGFYLDNRDVLQRLIAEIDGLNVGVVIVESTDRLGRGIAVLGRLWGELQDRGIEIHDATAGVPVDVVRFGITAAMAEADRNRIVANLESGRNKAAESGVPIMGRCFGYRFELDAEDRRVRVIDPDEARTVKDIFRLFLKGVPPSAIATMLNSDRRHGKTWRRSNICGSRNRPTGILRRLRYTGVQTFRATYSRRRSDGSRNAPQWRPVDDWLKSPVVPELQIIPPAVFAATQWKLAEADAAYVERAVRGQARNPYWGKKGSYVLNGLVLCGRCGSRAFIRNYGANGKALQCGSKRSGGGNCGSPQIPLYRIEDAVAELLGRELATLERSRLFIKEYNDAVRTRSASSQAERASIRTRLEQIDEEFGATFDQAYVEGIPVEWLAGKRHSLTEEGSRLRDRLAASEAQPAEPIVLSEDKRDALREPLEALLCGGRIDTSLPEGAEIIAAMRALVGAVRVDIMASGELDVRIDIRPSALSRCEDTGGSGTAELAGVFSAPPRGHRASRRHAEAARLLAAEGRHRLTDGQWNAISHMVPATFHRNKTAPVLQPRTVVEAAIFHLQSGVPMASLPEAFGPPAEVELAIRKLSRQGGWKALEPALRREAPHLFEGVRGSRMLPVGNPSPSALAPGATLAARLRAGLHRLTDGEWEIVARVLPTAMLAANGPGEIEARPLVNAAMFLAKERVYPCCMPRAFGRRDLLEAACWRLHSEGHWRRIVRALKSGSPETLRGADVSLFGRYWAPDRTFKLGGRKLDVAAVKAKLAEIEALVSSGCASREATARAGVPYTTYIAWRTNPVLRGVE